MQVWSSDHGDLDTSTERAFGTPNKWQGPGSGGP